MNIDRAFRCHESRESDDTRKCESELRPLIRQLPHLTQREYKFISRESHS